MHQKVQQTLFFCHVNKVEYFDKKNILLRFGKSKSPVKGLNEFASFHLNSRRNAQRMTQVINRNQK
jgi:hypothetical protein